MGPCEVITNAITGEQTIRPLPEESQVPSKEVQEQFRRAAYVLEADPLFFMAQRGEGTMAEWLAKVSEIKARYPY